MKGKMFLLMALLTLHWSACTQNESAIVLIETSLGNIKVKLYDETPLHRENFLKLVNDGFYTNTLFHRVIEGFMVQGGDPASAHAEPGQRLGSSDPNYFVDAEIDHTKYFHKKGALAAARQPDQVNPEKKSSSSQFYIVQGEVLTESDLERMAQMKTEQMMQTVFMKYVMPFRDQLIGMQQQGDEEGLQNLMSKLRADAEEEINALPKFKFTSDQISAYTSLGGTPQLDGDYTVFGEVVEGIEVIDKIAALKTDSFDRPLQDVSVKMKVINR